MLRQHVTRRCPGLARVALPAASLLWSVQVLAQRQTDVSPAVTQLSAVTVTSSMGSVQGNYKNFLNGYHAFVEKHEYAPNSRLEFHVGDASASDDPLQLKFETKSSYEDVPLDEDNNFELPIRQDDALLHGGLLANRPKGSVDVQPLVRSPGDGCASSEFRWWSPPPGGVIQDKTAAIAIARAMWASMNPELDIASEAEWQQTMVAHLDHGVWRITEPPLGPESLGGTGEFDLSATDGRMLRVVFTQ